MRVRDVSAMAALLGAGVAASLLVTGSVPAIAGIDPYTSSTIEPYTASTIEPYTSSTIEETHARPVAPYHAPTIKPLPPSAPVKLMARRGSGSGLPVPVACSLSCTILQAVWLDQINWLILNAYGGLAADGHLAAREHVVGRQHVRLADGGRRKVRASFAERYRVKLRRVKIRRLTIHVRTTIRDGRGGHRTRTSRVVLRSSG
jgi:hypothetical protein